MNRWIVRCGLLLVLLAVLPVKTPAPLIYRPGEGWSYEPVGGGKWVRTRAKDQLDVAREAFAAENYSLALKAARRTVKVWPLSDYAPEAQYLVGRCYEARGRDERAFKEYQTLAEKYPKAANYDDVLQRQYEIANRYLAGQWFKLWGLIPLYPSMEKTAAMYEKIVKNGPYSSVAPQAQLNIGAAKEKRSEFAEAVKAYEKAADRYHHNDAVAADALYRAGLAYQRQAKTAEYDQSIAGKAIATFSDFMILHPNDPRVEESRARIAELRNEQARGSYKIARFYEKRKRWQGAKVYYNEVVRISPDSALADEARRRIEELQEKVVIETAQN